MKRLTAIILILLIYGCSSKKESHSSPAGTRKENRTERITPTDKVLADGKATFKQRGYNEIEFPPVEVTYKGYDTGNFMFKSDEDEKTDTNGDGYVVYGRQEGDNFRLHLLDLNKGKTYDSGNKITFVKKEAFFLGSGLMDEVNSDNMIKVSFWVTFTK